MTVPLCDLSVFHLVLFLHKRKHEYHDKDCDSSWPTMPTFRRSFFMMCVCFPSTTDADAFEGVPLGFPSGLLTFLVYYPPIEGEYRVLGDAWNV